MKKIAVLFLSFCILQQYVACPCFLQQTYAETTAAEQQSAEDGQVAAESQQQGEPQQQVSTLIWPEVSAQINAESAIVMDADSGETLWGREVHAKRYPASITKLLTALVVLDHCSLDETVTFSESAVSNLESGAVTIGVVPGDTLSVEDCLYALLLKSANEVANALAEHVSGSVDAFAVLMNEKAAELGCQDSNFRNPSGLTDSEHVTSAYDMALIACACMDSDAFLALESEASRKLGPTTNYPGGLTVTIGHKMKKEGETYYDARVIAGKTGFTSASGNTLVTMARDEGRRLAIVVLKDTTPAHYTDTKALMDFGFGEFTNLTPTLTALNETLDLEETLVSCGYLSSANEETGEINEISFDVQPVVTVPRSGGLKDLTLEIKDAEGSAGSKVESNSEDNSEDNSSSTYETTVRDGMTETKACAVMTLSCLGHEAKPVQVSCYHLTPVADPAIGMKEETQEGSGAQEGFGDGEGSGSDEGGNLLVRGVFFLAVLAMGYGIYRMLQKKKEEERRRLRREKRQKRLQATKDMTDEEYRAYIEKEKQEIEKTYGKHSRHKSRFDVHSKDEEECLKHLSGMAEEKAEAEEIQPERSTEQTSAGQSGIAEQRAKKPDQDSQLQEK